MRPFYEGTGTILLQPSLSGYHIFHADPGERWILEPGVYWASEAAVKLGMVPMLHTGFERMRFDPGWANLGGDVLHHVNERKAIHK